MASAYFPSARYFACARYRRRLKFSFTATCRLQSGRCNWRFGNCRYHIGDITVAMPDGHRRNHCCWCLQLCGSNHGTYQQSLCNGLLCRTYAIRGLRHLQFVDYHRDTTIFSRIIRIGSDGNSAEKEGWRTVFDL
jgi:hypothetical protein